LVLGALGHDVHEPNLSIEEVWHMKSTIMPSNIRFVACALALVLSTSVGAVKHVMLAYRKACVHYVYFDSVPITPYTVAEIRANRHWRHRFSDIELKRLYSLIARNGNRAPFPPGTVRLVIDRNPWGPRALVGSLGNVKLGTHEYELTANDFAALKEFVNAQASSSIPLVVRQARRRHAR
jgi:hypothetical protein